MTRPTLGNTQHAVHSLCDYSNVTHNLINTQSAATFFVIRFRENAVDSKGAFEYCKKYKPNAWCSLRLECGLFGRAPTICFLWPRLADPATVIDFSTPTYCPSSIAHYLYLSGTLDVRDRFIFLLFIACFYSHHIYVASL